MQDLSSYWPKFWELTPDHIFALICYDQQFDREKWLEHSYLKNNLQEYFLMDKGSWLRLTGKHSNGVVSSSTEISFHICVVGSSSLCHFRLTQTTCHCFLAFLASWAFIIHPLSTFVINIHFHNNLNSLYCNTIFNSVIGLKFVT